MTAVTVISGCNAFYAVLDGGLEICLGDGVDRMFDLGLANEDAMESGHIAPYCLNLDDPLFCTQWASELANDQEWIDFMMMEAECNP